MLKRKNQDEKRPEVEWEPEPILCSIYADESASEVIAAVSGKFLG